MRAFTRFTFVALFPVLGVLAFNQPPTYQQTIRASERPPGMDSEYYVHTARDIFFVKRGSKFTPSELASVKAMWETCAEREQAVYIIGLCVTAGVAPLQISLYQSDRLGGH